MKFLRQFICLGAVVVFIGYLFITSIHDTIAGWVIAKIVTRGLKSGNIIVKDRKYGFHEATYENVWDFYRGKEL